MGGGAPVDTRIGLELYGNNEPGGGVYYPHQVLLLPSEVRYAIERSGALPSEIRMQAEQVGPLAPWGFGSYIPFESALQRAVRARPPILFGPAYGPRPPLPQPPPGPVPSAQVPPGQGYVRPKETMPAPNYIPPQMVDASLPAATLLQPNGTYEASEGIHYYPLRRHPTTAPASQPSLVSQLSTSTQGQATPRNQLTAIAKP